MADTSTMNIYQKLAKIRTMVEILKKNKKGYGYTYTSEDAILARVTAGMKQYNLSLVPKIVPGTTLVTPYNYTKTKVLKDGTVVPEQVNEMLIQGEMTFVWVNNDNPEDTVEVPWIFVGQQGDASQAFGSGLTYSNRYFLLKYFNASTSDDDPDRWRSEQAAASKQEDKLVAQQIVEQIDAVVQANVNDKNREDFKTELKKHVKKNGKPSVDYMSIEDPNVAKDVLAAVKTFFKVK